jgi:hypothetical protein
MDTTVIESFSVPLGVMQARSHRGAISASISRSATLTALMAYLVLYLAHGINDRTTVALIGTLASLALTAGLAVSFAGLASLSGLASEESVSLLAFAPGLDFRGLLVAAVIIGTLGVLDDVTVTQVAAVWELRAADPGFGPRGLYTAASRIGRDHIASTVNTLVLAYTAAALPLLLLLYTQSGLSFRDVLTNETIAVEVVQTLVGSIGLVASVPITTALALLGRHPHRRKGHGPRQRPGSGPPAPPPDRARAHAATRLRQRLVLPPTPGPSPPTRPPNVMVCSGRAARSGVVDGRGK